MSDPEGDGVRALLDTYSDAWWKDTIKRLTFHASRKLERRRWRGVRGGPAPGGHQAVDIVQGICAKVISGRRRWNPSRHPELFVYLRDQVDSEISNLVNSLDNRRVERLVAPTGDDGDEQAVDPLDGGPSPEDLVVSTQRESQAEEFALGFIDHLDGKTDLLETVGVILDSGDDAKPAAWADRLHVTAEEVYNRRKRLKRELKAYMAARVAAPPRKGGTTRA